MKEGPIVPAEANHIADIASSGNPYDGKALFYSCLARMGYPVFKVPRKSFSFTEDELLDGANGGSNLDLSLYQEDNSILFKVRTPAEATRFRRMWDVFDTSPIGQISYMLETCDDAYFMGPETEESITGDLRIRAQMAYWEMFKDSKLERLKKEAQEKNNHLQMAIDEYKEHTGLYLEGLAAGLLPLTLEELCALSIEQIKLLQQTDPDFQLAVENEEGQVL